MFFFWIFGEFTVCHSIELETRMIMYFVDGLY